MATRIEQKTELNSVGLPAPGRLRHAMKRTVLRPLPCTILAGFGIFGGLSALFVGLVLVVLHGIVPRDATLSAVGTVLLVAAVPMILIGSIFLDEIEKNRC
jgi:hypothetical protein